MLLRTSMPWRRQERYLEQGETCLQWLSSKGFGLHVAGRSRWGEEEAILRRGFEKLFRTLDLEIDAWNPAELVVFPEMALTTFFPRWYIEDEAELDSFYETEMPSAQTQPLFDLAKELGVGYATLKRLLDAGYGRESTAAVAD